MATLLARLTGPLGPTAGTIARTQETDMLLDKLWLRIRGEFLLLKEDLAAGGDLGEKAEIFLEKIEALFGAATARPDQETDRASRVEAVFKRLEDTGESADKREKTKRAPAYGNAGPTADELEKAWNDLARLRQEKRREPAEESIPPPNPRKLG